MADIAHGFTLSFASSGFSPTVIDVTPPGQTREKIETTHQGTGSYKTYMPSDLIDPGELQITIEIDGDEDIPIDQPAEEITMTFPSGTYWTFTGFCTDFTPATPSQEKMTGELTIAVSGSIEIDGGVGVSTSASASASPSA